MRGKLIFIISIIVICITISSGCIIGQTSDEHKATSPTYTYSGQNTPSYPVQTTSTYVVQTAPSSSGMLGSYPVTIDDPLGMGTQNIRTYSKTGSIITVVYSDGTKYARTGSIVTISNGPDVYSVVGSIVSISGNGAKYAKYA
ncbi:hypothetical protein [Methanocorpusculum sp. GPch4]|uniref:hypothetical protein n=1 Tax=Methanocorpusculum sp. GPch4 TaxID=2527877 RepID=UPI001ADE209D|nr:hypothetical protein [Methanocorpusculum sp. GPch4]